MKTQHLVSKLMELLRAEQSLIQNIKNFQRELGDLLQLRLSEEEELNLSISIYDTLRNETVRKHLMQKSMAEETGADSKNEVEKQKTLEIDYLSPFLINCVF